MLHRHVLEAITTTASINADSNIVFRPKQSTPLEELISSGVSLIDDTDDAVNIIESIHLNTMLKDSGGTIPHDLAMEEVVKLASDAVSSMLNITRNVVRPFIVDQVNKLEAYVDDHLEKGHRHEILPVFLESAFSNPSITSLTERYAETPVDDVLRSSTVFPKLDGAQLRELIKTGITRIDNDIATLLDDLPPEFLFNMYEESFRASFVEQPKGLDEQAQARLDRANAMLSFFIAKRFYEETPSEVTISLSEFNNAVAGHLSQAGRRIFRIVAQREAYIRQGRLILSMPQPNMFKKPIVVVGEVYNQYLKDGGKPEWLMGACLAGERMPSPTTLLTEGQVFQNTYDRAERMHKSQNGAKRNSALAAGMREQLSAYISAVDENDKSIVIDSKEVLRQRADEYIGSTAIHANLSTYEYVRVIICKVFFPQTEALRILTEIDAHAANNPALTPREAATLTTIDLVCGWVASQIDVVRNAR